MNNRERVLAALNHKQPDKAPYNISFTQKARQSIADYTGEENFDNYLNNCLSCVGAEPAESWREIEPDIWADQFGVRWNRSIDKDIGNVCSVTVTPETIDDYRFPDADDPTRYADYEKLLKSRDDGFFLANLGFSLYERAWTLAGMVEFLQYMITDPDFAHNLLERILEFNLRIIDNACSYDIDAMMFGDDWGMQTGLIMGPDLWHEFIGPRVRKMYQRVRSYGKFVFIHSCGKVDELFDDLIDSGLNVFNPFQPEVMDVFEVKKKYGDRLSFYGGISTQITLPYGTVEGTKDEVKRLIDEVGRDGGFIASPAHAIPGDVKPENYLAMMEVLESQ